MTTPISIDLALLHVFGLAYVVLASSCSIIRISSNNLARMEPGLNRSLTCSYVCRISELNYEWLAYREGYSTQELAIGRENRRFDIEG